jgi:ketosteroid isomerase-like protein
VSEANLEIVRRMYLAWQSDEPGSAPLEFLADEFEYVNPSYAVHPGIRRGKEGWTSAVRNLSESFDSWKHIPGETIAAGSKVVVIATFQARGRGSSVGLEKFEPQVWTLRDGKIVRFEWFSDRDEAMRAAGLSE